MGAGMLTAEELADLRATAGGLMTTPCTIQRAVRTSDGAGGFTDSWATAHTTVCHIAPADTAGGMGREQVTLGRLEATDTWAIALPDDTEITVADRISALGQTYEVVSLKSTLTESLQLIAECLRMQ